MDFNQKSCSSSWGVDKPFSTVTEKSYEKNPFADNGPMGQTLAIINEQEVKGFLPMP